VIHYHIFLFCSGIHPTNVTYSITRSTADAEGLHDMPQIQKIAFEKTCNRKVTFKDTEGQHNFCY